MRDTLSLKFLDGGLIPVIVQDEKTGEVLMMAYANEEAVKLTEDTGFAHYYSRSRKKLWKKGEESGHFQKVARILVDCDEDCLIYEVEQTGAACHTGYRSCFFRTLDGIIIGEKIFDPEKVYGTTKH
ncbi:phosphoribosyl-AMP cyclohydrolase [Methanoregula sp.]|uniref:phosphoribosyl-AMP cyclohydrolase n=1 Tax=Methanoregula sp. TaxID=2052170 RepID=UPI003C193FE9